ncbi:hypothetical protein HP398_05410 [Brevibacillus sp. HB1.4B]|uniref:hypothetical protein n=1 Tax=Brevibacillus sp. HB1.4B TaxID=2738845 RepID=UPI00156A980A|nr:hypothetical protein [Brevibacillus sp. HB1.4B]NRS15870.1 hypothetical protein [Brevibacillus sp. HB1.4B]
MYKEFIKSYKVDLILANPLSAKLNQKSQKVERLKMREVVAVENLDINKEQFGYIFSLFFKKCIVLSDYKASDKYSRIALNEKGNQYYKYVESAFRDVTDPEIKLAMFIASTPTFSFIDWEKTDTSLVKEAFENEVLNRKLLFPWIYDRLLYDKYSELFTIRYKEIPYDETIKLLSDTPQGIFQIGNYIVGPFGVLTSLDKRLNQPIRTSYIWHCNEPACRRVHSAGLSTGNCLTSKVLEYLEDELKKNEAAKKSNIKYTQLGLPDYYDDMHLGELTILLTNAFSELEIKNILKYSIDSYSKEIRALFPKNERRLYGSSDQICEQLSREECIQLILLLENNSIITVIEYLIDNNIIKIPYTEKRETRYQYYGRNYFDTYIEASFFGIRALPLRKSPSIRLKNLIESLYNNDEDLNWYLRHQEGDNTHDKLNHYLTVEDPKRIIKELVFASPQKMRSTFDFLRFGNFYIPTSTNEEEKLINKILWKLGYDLSLFPDIHKLFWDRLEKFTQTTIKTNSPDESIKEMIRSSGVNFFVSLEEVLDYSLSFSTWALLANHYADTGFKFNHEEARKFMAYTLSGQKSFNGSPLVYDEQGKNTLGPLIQGFSILRDVCLKILEEKESYKRTIDETPGYYNRTNVIKFPFQHKPLLLDLRDDDRQQILNFLIDITNTLERNRVANIRNRIEHKRNDFPLNDEIDNACRAISSIIMQMEQLGICPTLFHYAGNNVDKFDRGTNKYVNYKGKEVNNIFDNSYSNCRLPSVSVPQFIIPCMRIHGSNVVLRFWVQESSDYVDRWGEFDKIRNIKEDKTQEISFIENPQ